MRLSGPGSIELLHGIIASTPPTSAGAYRVDLRPPQSFANLAATGTRIAAWAYLFRSPRSYTGDDLVELHLPGNPLLVKLMVEDLIARGARQAEAGEFTSRAYLNGRLDLTAAEGVAMTIAAGNDAELKAARQLMSGELSRRIIPIMEQLADALALLEAGIDFVEEDISFIASDDLREKITHVEREVRSLVADTARIERITHEPRFALIGKPNAGKSTLLNALAGQDRAVVSPVAGTTRDALSVTVKLPRGMVQVIDVAGLERVGDDPHGIRSQMQARALRALEEVDFVIQVIDGSAEADVLRARQSISRKPDLIVLNKCDLLADQADQSQHAIRISALTGRNLNGLIEAMSDLAFGQAETSAALALGSRHIAALDDALCALARADVAVNREAAELIAHDLREALDALGKIIGHVTPDDLLGRIFGSFCIGK